MKLLFVKIKDGDTKQRPGKVEFENKINYTDFKLLGLLLFDLGTYGANIDKAFEEYKKLKNQEFPW